MDEFLEQRVEQLREVKKAAALGGGEAKIAKQRARGKLTARERIDLLLDPGSFVELQMLVKHIGGNAGDGIVVGYGKVNGRQVCVYSQDATVQGGSIGSAHGYKMYRITERALDTGVPIIGINDSPGARTPKMGPDGMSGFDMLQEKSGGSVFFPNTEASGAIPQISAMLGSCGGISVYSPALTDFIFMVDDISHMFITGPRVVKSVLGEDVGANELGGSKLHSRVSGVCDIRTKTEAECFEKIRKLLGFLPLNCDEKPPYVDTGDDPDRYDDELGDMIPCNFTKPFDMRKFVKRIVDNGDFLEIKPEWAGEIVTGFGRMGGNTVGVVANQPMVRAGSMTVDSSRKQARFIRFCDCFNIPVLMLVDTPAYMPGTEMESKGIIHHGAKVLYALCEATVPRVGVILRKAYGGGNLGMGTVAGMGTDFVYNWPIMELGIMGAEQSVDLFYGPQIQAADDPVAFKAQKVREYRDMVANPMVMASENPFVEDIIEPRETRRVIIRAFEALKNKKTTRRAKKHGNIPL